MLCSAFLMLCIKPKLVFHEEIWLRNLATPSKLFGLSINWIQVPDCVLYDTLCKNLSGGMHDCVKNLNSFFWSVTVYQRNDLKNINMERKINILNWKVWIQEYYSTIHINIVCCTFFDVAESVAFCGKITTKYSFSVL